MKKCHDCGAKVVSAGLVFCPKCSFPLSTRAKIDERPSIAPTFYAGFDRLAKF
ncbi:MAG: hypothetical protein ACM3ZC_03315 [Bacteroidota bacterium]